MLRQCPTTPAPGWLDGHCNVDGWTHNSAMQVQPGEKTIRYSWRLAFFVPLGNNFLTYNFYPAASTSIWLISDWCLSGVIFMSLHQVFSCHFVLPDIRYRSLRSKHNVNYFLAKLSYNINGHFLKKQLSISELLVEMMIIVYSLRNSKRGYIPKT